MAAQPVDALQCFTSLHDNLPGWIARVTDLAAHTSKKHAEFSEEFKRLAQAQPNYYKQQHHRRRKNSSVHSIRPGSEMRATRKTADDASSTASSFAAAEGAMDGSRPRRPLVIYYDTHTQTELEQMVRDIGAARNNLRKGKMAQMMRKSSLALDLFTSQSRHSLRQMQLPTDSFRRTRPAATEQKETAFDFADKQLEIAHILSESAAHQFLRFGECKKSLDDITAKFNILLEMSNNEVCRLRAEKEREPEVQNADEQCPASPLKERMASLKPVDSLNDEKSPDPGTAAIEVDDAASDSSIDIDITAFRSTRIRM